jgi:hypothetical protein
VSSYDDYDYPRVISAGSYSVSELLDQKNRRIWELERRVKKLEDELAADGHPQYANFEHDED